MNWRAKSLLVGGVAVPVVAVAVSGGYSLLPRHHLAWVLLAGAVLAVAAQRRMLGRSLFLHGLAIAAAFLGALCAFPDSWLDWLSDSMVGRIAGIAVFYVIALVVAVAGGFPAGTHHGEPPSDA